MSKNLFQKFSKYLNFNLSNSISLKGRKAISPVVATALLLVVAVVAVVSFQSWFESYSSSLFVDVEQDSSIDNFNIGVEGIYNNELFINAGNGLNITKVTLDGNECSNAIGVISGVESLNISDCINESSTQTPEIVILTNEQIISEQVYLNDLNPTSELSTPSSLDCSALNGGDWILVPGNGALGTSDFCVMKYEAKWNGSGTINNVGSAYCGSGNNYNVSTGCIDDTEGVISQASSLPLTNVNQFEAIELCSRLGSKYHLITDPQWVTIARNIEQVDANWNSGTAYNGSLKRGNTGDVVAGISYNAASDPVDRSLDTNSLALLNLSNGEGIWDFSGNIWEWTSEILPTNGMLNSSLGEGTGKAWTQWNTISASYNYLKSFNTSLTSANGIGRVYYDGGLSNPNDASWSTTHAFFRGGNWYNEAYAGAFALFLGYGPSGTNTDIGFRCAYSE